MKNLARATHTNGKPIAFGVSTGMARGRGSP